MKDNLRTLDTVTFVLVVIGALNWLMVGLFGVDLVAELAGLEFGLRNWFTNLIYILVGLSAIAQVALYSRRRRLAAGPESEAPAYRRPPTRMAPH